MSRASCSPANWACWNSKSDVAGAGEGAGEVDGDGDGDREFDRYGDALPGVRVPGLRDPPRPFRDGVDEGETIVSPVVRTRFCEFGECELGGESGTEAMGVEDPDAAAALVDADATIDTGPYVTVAALPGTCNRSGCAAGGMTA